MLIKENSILMPSGIDRLIASACNQSSEITELEPGVYQVCHFGSSDYLPGYNHYAELSIEPYGVCDNTQQIFDKCPEIKESSDRQFVITVTLIEKKTQPPEGGWRWHKWGPYIGDHTPEYEYLYEEDDIDKVYVYHIYEKEIKEFKPCIYYCKECYWYRILLSPVGFPNRCPKCDKHGLYYKEGIDNEVEEFAKELNKKGSE